MELNGLTIEIRRSQRRKTLSLTVDRSGELVLHAPTDTARTEVGTWAQTKLLWVHRKLALKDAAAPSVRDPEYVAGRKDFEQSTAHEPDSRGPSPG